MSYFTRDRASRPERSRLGHIASTAEHISKIIAVVAALSGGLFAVWQYGQKVDQERVAQSIKFAENYRSTAARKTIAARVLASEARIFELQEAAGKQDDWSAYETFLADLILQPDEDAFFDLLDAYQIGAVCLQQRLCDCKSLMAFVGEEARRTKVLLFPAVMRKRKMRDDPSLGEGLDYLAERSKSGCR